jgi:drug/metabolite transporter (DMT)-like permease
VVWAIYTILNRRVVQGRPPVLVTAGMMVTGWLLVLPIFLARSGWNELNGLGAEVWANLLAIGLLSTALPYLLYTHALKHAEAARLAAIQNIEPLIAVLFAAALLHEPLTWVAATGGAGIVAGVYLAEAG